jgi:hypothetical protein
MIVDTTATSWVLIHGVDLYTAVGLVFGDVHIFVKTTVNLVRRALPAFSVYFESILY